MEGQTEIVYVTDSFLEGRLLQRDPLEYPQISRPVVPAIVRFSVTVDEEGNIEESMLLHGHPLLNQAAQRQLASMRYRPYVRGAVRYKMRGDVTVVFDFAESAVVGLDLPPIQVLDEGLFSAGGRILNINTLKQWLETQTSRSRERTIHIWIPGNTRVDELIRTLRSVHGLTLALHFED